MADAEKATVSSSSTAHAPTPTPRPRRIADPTPLGLYAFASTLLVLSLYNCHARHVSVPNVIVGMALFYGGLAQLLAGMWAFAYGNVLAATAFPTYGAFLMSYAALLIPGSGVIAAYDDPSMFDSAVGIYLMAFMIVSLFFTVASLRHSLSFIVLFGALIFTFMFLGAAKFTGSSGLTKAGGYLGVTAAIAGYYSGTALLLGPHDVVSLPLGLIKPRSA